MHALSPLLAPIYLVCGLLQVDVAEAQRFALKWAILVSLIVLIASLLTGAIPTKLRLVFLVSFLLSRFVPP